GIKLGVHARLLVGPRNKAAEGLQHLFLGFSGQRLSAPSVAKGGLRAGAVALGEQPAAKRESPLARNRHVARKGADGGKIRVLLPQHGLATLTEHDQARPAWIGSDEVTISRKIGVGVIASQDRPFDQLAGEGILDAALYIRRILRLAAAGEFDCLLHRRKVGFRGGGGKRERQRRFIVEGCGCRRRGGSGVKGRLWQGA